jgi:hypothetical protein
MLCVVLTNVTALFPTHSARCDEITSQGLLNGISEAEVIVTVHYVYQISSPVLKHLRASGTAGNHAIQMQTA